ncbi:MAG: tetratricopeptide repeat protein [Candidatus Aminicenantaceae bacterium]
MKKNISTIFLIFFLVLSCLIFMNLKFHIDRIPRKKIPGSSIIYLPKGKYLKYATFGYTSLAADLIYIWAIQYYSDYSISDRFDYLEHIFTIIIELDPHYLDVYEIAAMISGYEAKDVELAIKFLDMGLERNPDQWIFPFEAGHYARDLKRDYSLAQEYFKKASNVESSPPLIKRLYASAAFEAKNYQTAWKTWKNIYETTKDDHTKKIAANHLYRVKASIDIAKIEQAVDEYKKKYGRNPPDLKHLVQAGLLDSIPKDFDQNKYLYNPRNGEVKTPVMPWKR